VLYTGNDPVSLQKAKILVRNLAAIGIHVEVDPFPGDVLFKKIGTSGEPWDIAEAGWGTDGYFDPFDFLNILFDGNLADTVGLDLSRFDDPAYNRRLEAAARLTGSARYAAYARLDADLVRKAAPVVALSYWTSQDFFSARMGCQQLFGPVRIDLAALCIRAQTRR
jgi:ABC-type oligopeptide transport system substrate-binding subunit